MPTDNPFPLNILPKVDSPELIAWLTQYGFDKYVNAADINKILIALQYLSENVGSGSGSQNLQSVTAGEGNYITTNPLMSRDYVRYESGGLETYIQLCLDGILLNTNGVPFSHVKMKTDFLTFLRTVQFPDKDGTIAFTNDMPKLAIYKIGGQTNTTFEDVVMTYNNGVAPMAFDASSGAGQFQIIGYDPDIHYIAYFFVKDSVYADIRRSPTVIPDGPFGTYDLYDLSSTAIASGCTIAIGEHNI